MSVIRNVLFTLFVPVVSFCGICLGEPAGSSEEVATNFSQALATVLQQSDRPRTLTYHDFQSAADDFLSKHSDAAAVELASARIQDANSRKLALLVMAKLAPSYQAAKNALFDEIRGQNRIAIVAIAYLDSDDGRVLAEELIASTGFPGVRKAAGDMLVGLGNERTLSVLKRAATDEKHPFVTQALNSAVRRLEYRLTKVPANQQTQWAQQEIAAWRAVAETPLPRHVGGEYVLAAKTLHMQGVRFAQDFLRYKLDADDDMLALAAIGNQKEVWAVQSLERYIKQGDTSGDIARVSLAQIGTDEALRVLERSIMPSGSNRANTHILSLLELHGDENSAASLELLSVDHRFSERQRTVFRVASEAIRSRIAQGLSF